MLSILLQHSSRGDLVIESLSQLDTPLDTGSVHLEKGETHDVDEDGGDDTEDPFPKLFTLGPEIAQLGIKLEQTSGRESAESPEARFTMTIQLTTAMKAPPIQRAMNSPVAAPAQI